MKIQTFPILFGQGINFLQPLSKFPNRTEGDNTENRLCQGGGGGARFQMRHVNGKIFSEILVGGTKGGGIQCFVVVHWWKLVKVSQFFLNQLQK